MRMRRILLVLLVLLLILPMTSCGARKKAREKAAEVAQGAVEKVVEKAVTQVAKEETREAAQEATPTPKPRRLPTPTQTPAAEARPAEEGGESADILMPDKLNSFRLHTLFRTVTEEETASMEYRMAFVKEPPASHIVTIVTDQGSEETVAETIQIGDTVYIRTGEGQWMTASGTGDIAKPQDALAIGQGYYVRDLAGCKDLGVETVAGLKARHYRCDESSEQWKGALLVPGFLEGQMDVWVSSEYDAAIKGISHYKAKDQEGKISEVHMEFEYSDINQPIEITAPEGVQVGLPEDIPLIEGAEQVVFLGPVASFQVAKPAKEVSDYYIAAMQENGWSYKGDESMPPMMHSFAKGERQVGLMLNEEGGKTSAMLTFGEAQD